MRLRLVTACKAVVKKEFARKTMQDKQSKPKHRGLIRCKEAATKDNRKLQNRGLNA